MPTMAKGRRVSREDNWRAESEFANRRFGRFACFNLARSVIIRRPIRYALPAPVGTQGNPKNQRSVEKDNIKYLGIRYSPYAPARG